MRKIILTATFIISALIAGAQQRLGSTPEQIKDLTPEWKGERSADGRPRVSDELLERLKAVTVDEAWEKLKSKGYLSQYEGDWQILHSDSVMTGRVVTAQYMPQRPDLHDVVTAMGKAEGRSQHGGQNLWPIDILTNGDIYVADAYGKIADGTLMGSSLSSSVWGRAKRGVIFYGSIRDVAEVNEIKGFNAWIKGTDPSAINQVQLTSINQPVRIGRVTVLPGDVVLANKYGTVFIPAYLVADLVLDCEFQAVHDQFERVRLLEAKYLSGQIHGDWSDEIKNDFVNWLGHYPGKLPMPKKELDEYLKAHGYTK
jgi:4-hydroxy-4-methyl-2-oxoglutarate aldolase